MPRRTATPFLIGFAVVAIAGVGALWGVDAQRREARHTASAVSTHLVIAKDAVDQLRLSQTASLISGQRQDDWEARATASLVQLDSALANLASTSHTAEAKPHYDAATGFAAQVRAIDKKLHGMIRTGQTDAATDVAFQEGAETAKMLAAELESARDIELAAFERAATRLGYIDLTIGAVGLLIGLVLLVLATRGGGEAAPTADGLSLNTETPADTATPAQTPSPGTEVSSNPFAAPSADLSGAAALCVDLGRIVDGRDLPGLMARAAAVLEAKGLVLWVLEGTSQLRPSVAHGYPERVLQRMGTLPTDGDNVTSLAFRTTQPQTLRSSVEGFGAIAVPLLTGSGCVGVLAAEMQGAKPGDPRFDIARMIAAQLSTLVAPGTSSSTASPTR